MRGIRRRLKGVRGVGLRVVLVPILFIPGQRDIGRSLEELLPELAVAGQLVYTLSSCSRIASPTFPSLHSYLGALPHLVAVFGVVLDNG